MKFMMNTKKTKNKTQTKVKLIRQNYGSGLALGVEGSKEEVERFSNLFYNWKGTQSDPIWMGERFAYLLTDEQRFLDAYTKMYLVSLGRQIGKDYRGRIGGFINRARIRSLMKYQAIPEEKFLPDVVIEALTWE